ncbi:uncharacterized protein CEXT_784951 [Caerostris extrusa]|uniref:Uncharacterized protein n=1 Tax=Caerostris extrusa TaxID=172846 RepID=A0AAV4S4J3_CAEEX|nr:uncharacterized protein CEXT_784951 [Caerostris extrusa]
MTIFLLWSLSLLSSSWACLWESVPPCSCRPIGTRTTEVTCTGAISVDELQNSLIRVQGQPIQTLFVMDSSLLYFPSDVFMGLKVEKLHLFNSTLADLTDSEEAFEGLGKSLKTLVIEECTILNGLRWEELKNLKNLTTLKTVKANLNAIEDISEIAHLNLDNLELIQDSISYIDDKAFAPFQNLKVLSSQEKLHF